MRIDLLNLFPEMFTGVFEHSIIKRAREKGLLELVLTDIRDYATDIHRSVDDRPYGGGSGMVMMCGPVFAAVEDVAEQGGAIDEVILLTPQGRRFDQALARELAGKQRLVLIAGRYEGFDERIREHLATREISIGDYVLSGGEIPAMAIVDAVARLLPGVLGCVFAGGGEFSGGAAGVSALHAPGGFRGVAGAGHTTVRASRGDSEVASGTGATTNTAATTGLIEGAKRN